MVAPDKYEIFEKETLHWVGGFNEDELIKRFENHDKYFIITKDQFEGPDVEMSGIKRR